jgi:hypothetical protein
MLKQAAFLRQPLDVVIQNQTERKHICSSRRYAQLPSGAADAPHSLRSRFSSLSRELLTAKTLPPVHDATQTPDSGLAPTAHDLAAPVLLLARLHSSHRRHNTTVWTDSRQESRNPTNYSWCQRLHWSQRRHNSTVWTDSRQESRNPTNYSLCQRLHWSQRRHNSLDRLQTRE